MNKYNWMSHEGAVIQYHTCIILHIEAIQMQEKQSKLLWYKNYGWNNYNDNNSDNDHNNVRP